LVLKVLLEFKVLQDPMVLKDMKVSKDHKETEPRVRSVRKETGVHKVLKVLLDQPVRRAFKEAWVLKVLRVRLRLELKVFKDPKELKEQLAEFKEQPEVLVQHLQV
jgi:hypothetical protein